MYIHHNTIFFSIVKVVWFPICPISISDSTPINPLERHIRYQIIKSNPKSCPFYWKEIELVIIFSKHDKEKVSIIEKLANCPNHNLKISLNFLNRLWIKLKIKHPPRNWGQILWTGKHLLLNYKIFIFPA